MNRFAIPSPLFLLISLLLCCHPKPKTINPISTADLLNHRWLLKKLYPKDQPMIMMNKVIPELITRLDSTFHGFGGCNQYSGTLKTGNGTDSGTVQFSNILSTEMYCEESSLLEQAWIKTLTVANRWKVQQNHLYLYQDTRILAALEAWYE